VRTRQPRSTHIREDHDAAPPSAPQLSARPLPPPPSRPVPIPRRQDSLVRFLKHRL
jgi:hypothetical protein